MADRTDAHAHEAIRRAFTSPSIPPDLPFPPAVYEPLLAIVLPGETPERRPCTNLGIQLRRAARTIYCAGYWAAEKYLERAGRLLPSGGETHERWAVVAYRGGGADMITADPYDDTWRADETEEEWARRTAAEYAAQPGVIRVGLQRRDVHFGPWARVPNEPAEETKGG